MLEKKGAEEFKRLKYIVEHCDFKEPRDVELHFEALTMYIWNYKMIGQIYDFYPENIEVRLEGGRSFDFDAEMNNCIWMLNACPDMGFKFIDIMAHKVSDDEFKFVQVTTYEEYATSTGPSVYGPPTGLKMGPHNNLDMCECRVKKVNGHWIIVDEWIVDSKKRSMATLMGCEF